MERVSYYEIGDERTYILDDGYIGDNSTEYHPIGFHEMNSDILKTILECNCRITRTSNQITIEKEYDDTIN